jgi:hypothetical protein
LISSCFKAQSMAESFLFSSTVAALGSAAAAAGAGVLAAGALLGCDGVAAGWAATGGVESGGLLGFDLQPAISKAAARNEKRILVWLLMALLSLGDNGRIVHKSHRPNIG